jgi:hypothetical protein
MRIDAVGIMQEARRYKPKPIAGLAEPAAVLRDRIGKAEAILGAGRDSEASPDSFRAGCAEMLAHVHELRRAWVGAFGRDWVTGEPVPVWKRPDTIHVALMQSAYVSADQLRFHKGWVRAANMTERIHMAERQELERPAREEAEGIAAAEHLVKQRADRLTALEARRQEQDRVAFRTGTQTRVAFPNERKARQKVASRWG